MNRKIDKSEKLTLEKIEQEFTLINSVYFSEVNYDIDGRFFDLYLQTTDNKISNHQIETYNNLVDNLNEYQTKINDFIKFTYTKSELKKANELNKKKLNVDVIEISNNNLNFDAVLVCSKQHKYFGLIKRDIGIRAEIKNGLIKTIERKTNTLKENLK